MSLDADTCYRALRAKDPRFDGLFFVGVKTTGIYCRPICPARTPARERCTFYALPAEAERAGFRACFRCRPELAPGRSSIESVPRLVLRAAARIEAGYLNEHSIDALAKALGVTARHLRRSMERELGINPIELAQTRRLALAKQLLQDSAMPVAEVAFASGFASVRRFNAVFADRFGQTPSSLRRGRTRVGAVATDSIVLRLDHRPPLEYGTLLRFLRDRAIPGVESVEGDRYRRSVAIGRSSGWLEVGPVSDRSALQARVSASLAPHLMEIAARLRALFDLDARPDAVDGHLAQDQLLAPWIAARPGLRVPGAFDGFEVGARAILGQQVSVRAATTLSGRLVERFGAPIEDGLSGIDRTFPSAETLAGAGAAAVKRIGLTQERAQTIVALSQAVADGRIDLSEGADPERSIEELQQVRGIGSWTAHYLAMRALRWPNAFPSGDLVLKRALGVKTARQAEARAAAWQPWRAYGVMHVFSSVTKGE